MSEYKPRKIAFRELIEVDGWKIKVYTISKTDEFSRPVFYAHALKQLSSWLRQENNFDASNDKMAFLILHAGTEGIFSIINWWVGKNMLNTHIYFTSPDQPDLFEKISGDGLAPCVWELEVINHERLSWMNHILKGLPSPDYEKYLKDTMEIVI